MTKNIDEMDVKEAFILLAEYKQEVIPSTKDEEGQFEDLEEVYIKARFGVNMNFDIYDYIYDLISFSKIKAGKLIYRGRALKMSDFWTEIEARNNIIKTWLRENTEKGGLASSYEIQQ